MTRAETPARRRNAVGRLPTELPNRHRHSDRPAGCAETEAEKASARAGTCRWVPARTWGD